MTLASLAGALIVLPTAALARGEDARTGSDAGRPHHHRAGLVGAALKLDSLTPEQRSSIHALVAQRRQADLPVRQADARVLTVLAQQVEQAKVDPQGLAPTLGAEQGAAAAEAGVDRDTLDKLHAILTAAQRNQLVDLLEARSDPRPHSQDRTDPQAGRFGRGLDLTAQQRSTILANLRASPGRTAAATNVDRRSALEAFRGDSFDAAQLVQVRSPGAHMEQLAEAMVPVLSPSQRATFASHLRARAAHAEKGA